MHNQPSHFILFCLLFIGSSVYQQRTSAQCFSSNEAFLDKEEIRYSVSYNWGPVWVDAGLVTFSATLEPYMGKTVWHFKGTGKSYPSYDLFFKVRDYFDSYTDPETFEPCSFRRYVYEGGYTLLNTLDFNYNIGKVISGTKAGNKPQRADTLPVVACGFDMLSAIYYTRNIDFSQAVPGWKKEVKVVIDDLYYDIVIRFLGREAVVSPEGKQYSCIKFAAKMVQGTIFKGDEDVLVWVTDDQNKIPVYIEAKIIVGTVKAYLKDYKNLRNPKKY
jgi:hypothetical protein